MTAIEVSQDRAYDERRGARIPLRDYLTSLAGVGPMPFTQIFRCRAMVDEQNRIDAADRDAEVLSNAEEHTRSPAVRRAQRVHDRATQRDFLPRVREVLALRAKRDAIAGQIRQLEHEPLVGPHGEHLLPETADQLHRDLAEKIANENAKGAARHRRVSPRTRRFVRRWLPLIDLPILTLFVSVVLNANLADPLQTPVAAVSALLFGILGTLAIAAGLSFLGVRHRAYKNEQDQWDAARGGRTQLAIELGAALAMIGLIAALMGYRILSEAAAAEVEGAVAWLLAATFGLATALLNAVIYLAEFRDGSRLTEQLDPLAGGLAKIAIARQHLTSRVDIIDKDVNRRLAEVEGMYAQLRQQPLSRVKTSAQDAAIRYARSVHQATGSAGTLPTPGIDFTSLDTWRSRVHRTPETEA